jgi:hypothetical protein
MSAIFFPYFIDPQLDATNPHPYMILWLTTN